MTVPPPWAYSKDFRHHSKSSRKGGKARITRSHYATSTMRRDGAA
jgi:hypothetical protein